jgi:hypothetical protein
MDREVFTSPVVVAAHTRFSRQSPTSSMMDTETGAEPSSLGVPTLTTDQARAAAERAAA